MSQDEEEYVASNVRVQTDLCHTRQGNSTDKHKAISSEQTVSNADEASQSVRKSSLPESTLKTSRRFLPQEDGNDTAETKHAARVETIPLEENDNAKDRHDDEDERHKRHVSHNGSRHSEMVKRDGQFTSKMTQKPLQRWYLLFFEGAVSRDFNSQVDVRVFLPGVVQGNDLIHSHFLNVFGGVGIRKEDENHERLC